MSLRKKAYSILVVSAAENFNRTLPEVFSVSQFDPMNVVSNISAAKRAVAERDFDFVVINAPLPDDSGVRFALDTADAYPAAVILFLARAEQYEDAYDKLAVHGVFLIKKPIARAVFEVAVDWLISARERLRRSEKRALSIKEKMSEIRLVNRAKWLLIRELNMSEPDAHRYIEKQAMDRCVSRKAVAEEIVRTYQ